jgi:quercetin dioxygenase-like cupin family protein
MTLRRSILILAPVIAIAAATLAARAQQPPARPGGGVVIVKPGDIQWTDYPGRPGVRLAMIEGDFNTPGPFLMRVKFPPNYTLPPHMHPGIEHTIILSGALRVGYCTATGGPMETLPAGTVLITPAQTPHFLETTEETIVQTHGMAPWGSMPPR